MVQPLPRASSAPNLAQVGLFARVEMAERSNERGASAIPVGEFRFGVDDFGDWISKFERAVTLATNPQSDARKQALCLAWLPLKLDAEAGAYLKQIDENATYDVTKAALERLLVNPLDAYKWRAMKTQIVWDGKESFHVLSSRIKRAVDTYEDELNPAGKRWAYYMRFREALPERYQEAIDIGIPKSEYMIENAIELATRVSMTRAGKDSAKPASQASSQVSFTGAALADDRIHTLEMEMASLKTGLSNRDVGEKSSDGREERRPSRDSYDGRYPSGQQRYRDGSGSSEQFRRFSRDRYQGNRDQSFRRDWSFCRDADRHGDDRHDTDCNDRDRLDSDHRGFDRRVRDRRDMDRRDYRRDETPYPERSGRDRRMPKD